MSEDAVLDGFDGDASVDSIG
jgi:hypothetical protein